MAMDHASPYYDRDFMAGVSGVSRIASLSLAFLLSLPCGETRSDALETFTAIVDGTITALILGRQSPIGDDVIGIPTVLDGDTLEIHGQRIRLAGIDAPESDQPCFLPGNIRWGCGRDAAFVLSDKIQRKTIRCRPYDHDQYSRLVAVCYHGAEDLNNWMVYHGWAVAYEQYSKRYVRTQREAENAKRGVWASSFDLPWVWRRNLKSLQ